MTAATNYRRDSKHYPNYRVGDDGTVWRKLIKGWKRLDLKPDKRGRTKVGLYDKEGKRRVIDLYSLVAEVYLPPRPSKRHVVRHKNGNNGGNSAANLYWAVRDQSEEPRCRGEDHWCSKLTEKEVRKMKNRLEKGERVQNIARELGVDQKTVRDIRDGVTWKHVS